MIDVCESPLVFMRLNTSMSIPELNTLSLFVFHIFFIAGLFYFAYNLGKREGATSMIEDMIDRKLFTLNEFKNKYLD